MEGGTIGPDEYDVHLQSDGMLIAHCENPDSEKPDGWRQMWLDRMGSLLTDRKEKLG